MSDSSAPDVATLSYMIATALRSGDENRPRSAQKASGVLGPSDIGFCRQKAALVTRETPPSDADAKWAAYVGTALGEKVERDVAAAYSSWWSGNETKTRVTAHLANGAEISGTPDLVTHQMVADIKSKDGFEWVLREPWPREYLFQTWLYAKGLIEAGVFDPKEPIWCVLIYVDRSGKIETPHVVATPWDPTMEDEICSWIDDVIYAVKHDEDAERDIVAPICERICEFFTVCRGGLPMGESDLILDEDLVKAVELYREGMDMEKEGKRLKGEMAEMLTGVNGRAGQWEVRHTVVNGTDVPGYYRRGYDRIDVRRAR